MAANEKNVSFYDALKMLADEKGIESGIQWLNQVYDTVRNRY